MIVDKCAGLLKKQPPAAANGLVQPLLRAWLTGLIMNRNRENSQKVKSLFACCFVSLGMKSAVFILLVCFCGSGLLAQEVEVVRFPDLQQMIEAEGTDIRVINFWATWCKPCIEEIGYFEEVNKNYPRDEVRVLLVSLDFAEELETKVKRFVAKKGLKAEVVLLDETDYNAFIDQISPEWSGAIPATLLVNAATGKKAFFEKQFKEGELQQTLASFMKEP